MGNRNFYLPNLKLNAIALMQLQKNKYLLSGIMGKKYVSKENSKFTTQK
jgi:hypothetical protein